MTTNTRTLARNRLAEAKTGADNAPTAEAVGNHAEAKCLWKIELGSELPVG